MKKVLTISVLVALVLMLACTVVKATTESELEEFILGTHKVAGKEVTLTSSEKKQVKDYFAANELTDAQATTIKTKIDECISIMNKAGVTDVKKLSTSDKQTLLVKAQEAATVVGLKVDMSTGLVTDANGEPVFKLPDGKLVQTGSSNIVYIILAGVAIIAIAGTVVYKKVRA